MLTYVILVLISPLVLKGVKRLHPLIVLAGGFAIYCAAYYVRFEMSYSNWLLDKLGPFGTTFFEYLLGALAFKYRVFSRIYEVWQKLPRVARWILAAIIFEGMLYSRTKIVPSLFVAPVTGFVVMTLFHFWRKPATVQKAFLFVGNHSTNLWLTHMFFYSCLFTNLVYVARYPLLIFALMLAITLTLSMLLKLVETPIQRRIARI